jgi:pyruvate/2-oxoglutarate dehydrogenase complex dihydrolipoamide acyltransferase (E2) component
VSSSPTETLVDVTMPQMGVSVVEGTVVEWKKRVGDWVQADEIIASISTDKIDTDVEAPATGRVQEVIVEVGTTVDVGTVMARIATDAKPGEPHVAESAGADSVADSTGAAASPEREGVRRYSPVVMRMAAEHGIDLEKIDGTGRGGRVRKQDVLAFLENGATAAPEEPPMHIESPYRPDEPAPAKTRKPRFEAPPAAVEAAGGTAPLSRMRQSIGSRMLQSLQTAATCTTVVEADLIRIEAARAKTGFTYLPYIARATIEALREFPALNATLEDDQVTTYDGVHLGIAVSLGEGGLIVPVIRDAQELSVEGLGSRIKDLAKRGRSNQLTPDEVRGGSFTITNPGGYGSIIATPVINQPQVAILDTEAVVKRPVVITDEFGNDSIAIRPMTYLCMSWDHRALDGALAAQFLNELRKKLESWPTT